MGEPQQMFGFSRTICDCEVCKQNCRQLSGMIAPEDLRRWQQQWGKQRFLYWCMEHLAASPGAIVMHQGQVRRIPTLVPRRVPGGRCHWLTAQDQCAIHATAPYGCGYFDCQQTRAEGDARSAACLWSILDDCAHGGLYADIWLMLREAGVTVEAPETIRQRMREDT